MNFEIKNFFEKSIKYTVKDIRTERITYDNIREQIAALNKNLFNVEVVGKSINDKNIHCISFGKGDIPILAWSQMHGDEPTATAVIFDLLNFFTINNEYNSIRDNILNKLKFYFVPMLNPDGSDEHKRENFVGIDINRDALRIQSPESKILWELSTKIKPDFAFNLHDQNSYYTAGRSGKSSALSFLAPHYDYNKSANAARSKSMKVISVMFNQLSKLIPQQIARYKDDYEPRAFGDNFSLKNISTILIESGFIIGDENKYSVRELTFAALITALYSISTTSYENVKAENYYDIPENESLLFDLLLRNLKIKTNNHHFTIDIGINRQKKFDTTNYKFYFTGTIKEIGDLSIYKGIEEYNLDGYDVGLVKTIGDTMTSLKEIKLLDFDKLHSQGFGAVKYDSEIIDFKYVEQPINIIPSNINYTPSLSADSFANLIISKNDKIDFVIINGFFKKVNNENKSILNGIVIS